MPPKPPHLLSLATEVRLQIYAEVLHIPHGSLGLLSTCSQISMEAQPLLYRRPLTFASQYQLFAWVERSREQHLRKVTNLTLGLADIDLSPLLSPGKSNKVGRSSWQLYQDEMRGLDDAFRQLPNVRDLTLLPPESLHSLLYRNLYHSFLALLPLRFPQLQHLTIHGDDRLLAHVPGLKALGSVTFTELAPEEDEEDDQKHRDDTAAKSDHSDSQAVAEAKTR